jgi:hypothetical protein
VTKKNGLHMRALRISTERADIRRNRSRRPAGSAALLATITGAILLVGLAPSADAATSPAPVVGTTYPGVSNDQNSPPSGTIAANKSEVVELANTGFEVVTAKGKVKSGTVGDLFNANGFFLSDPQVIWDASSNRFYVSMFENHGSSSPNEGLAWGFSKTAHPTSARDFCTYFNTFNYGATSFPDQESLGDTTHFLMIASDRFSTSDEELGSDVAWISKPPAGKTCPAGTAFNTGIQALANPDGSSPYRPTPARQVDTNPTGWITATTNANTDTLTVFQATETATHRITTAVVSSRVHKSAVCTSGRLGQIRKATSASANQDLPHPGDRSLRPPGRAFGALDCPHRCRRRRIGGSLVRDQSGEPDS